MTGVLHIIPPTPEKQIHWESFKPLPRQAPATLAEIQENGSEILK